MKSYANECALAGFFHASVFYPVGEAQLQCAVTPGAKLAQIKHPSVHWLN